jgi:hypothetical protein
MKAPLNVADWDTIPPVLSLRRTALLLGADPDTIKQ